LNAWLRVVIALIQRYWPSLSKAAHLSSICRRGKELTMPHSRNLDLRRSLLDLSAEQLAQRLSILVRYLLRLEASALSLDNSLLGPFLLLGRVTHKTTAKC
jgi:hypothetical protein